MKLDRKINLDSGYIRDTLKKNIIRFRDPGAIHCIDSNMVNPEHWHKAKYKILFLFLSSVQTRAVSATDNVLFNIIEKEYGEDVFVDMCSFPEKENFPLFEELELPAFFGTVTHRSWKDFDVIFVSNSTIDEKINLPWFLYHSGLPIWYTQRKDREDLPSVLLGGSVSDMSDIFLGDSDDGKDHSLIDGAFIGYGEGMICQAIDLLREGKEKGLKKEQILRTLFKLKSFLHPEQFLYEYADNGWHIKKVTKNPEFPEAFDVVEYNRPDSIEGYPGFERKILHPIIVTSAACADIQISMGCSSGAGCFFCKENHVAGGWREKSLSAIEKEFADLKRWAQPDRVGVFSYNSNYHTQYMKLISLSFQYFSRGSFIGMRADTIAARPDYFEFNKRVGQSRISFGIEGISERIRNGYLNKQLSEQEIVDACITCFKARFIEVKFFCINTELETEEDFDEFTALLKRLTYERDRLGASTIFRVSATNLCYYPETPLQWERRITIENALSRRRGWKVLFKKVKEQVNAIVKWDVGNMTGLQFLYPQLMLDLHRLMTPIMVKATLEQGILYHRHIKPSVIDWLMGEVKERGYELEDLLKERPDDFIFSGSYIFTLSQDYLRRARDILRKAVSGDNIEGLEMCLSTPAKPDNRKCHDCGYCKTPKQKSVRLKREFDTTTTIDESLLQVALNKPKYKLLVKLYRSLEFRYLSPISSWYYTLSCIWRNMSAEDPLKVYAANGNWEKLLCKDAAGNFIAGVQLGTVEMKQRISIAGMKKSFEEIRSEIKGTVFVDAKYVPLSFKYQVSYNQILLINTQFQDYFIRDKIMSFDGRVKKSVPVMGNRDPKFTLVSLDLSPLLFLEGTMESGSYVIASIPANINPFAFMSSLTGRKFSSSLSEYKITRMLYYKEGMSICTSCGRSTMYDLFEFEDLGFCEICYRKAVIAKIKASLNKI